MPISGAISSLLSRALKSVRKQFLRILLGLSVVFVICLHTAGQFNIAFIDQLENILYDARLKLTLKEGTDASVVILDIDEKSLALPELGRWPWGQDKMAAIVNTLFDRYHVKILGFDAVWAEKDTSSGLDALKKLAQEDLKTVPGFAQAVKKLEPQLDHEALFASALKDRPVVLGFFFNSAKEPMTSGVLPDPSVSPESMAQRDVSFPLRNGYGANLPSLVASTSVGGHFSPTVDPDGVIRRVPLFLEYKGQYYEALSLAMLRLLMGIEHPEHTRLGRMPDLMPGIDLLPDAPENLPSGTLWPLEAIGVGPVAIPVDQRTQALIPFRGPPGSFQYVSLADVYKGTLPVETLRDKIVIVGTTALGLADLRSTPVSAVYPGVEVHANLISGMIHSNSGGIKSIPVNAKAAEFLALMLLGGVFAWLLPFIAPTWSTLVTSLTTLGLLGLNLYAWEAGLVLPLASLILLLLSIYVLNMAYGYLVEARSKRQFTELFGQYVPPELVDKMAEDPEKYSMEGKKEVLTVLFSDVVGFTSISERLSPHELAAFINEYLTTMSQVIREQGGTLDKYIGDAIMAFWGAPVPDPGHATNAVVAALRMQSGLNLLRQSFEARGWPSIAIGIGLSSGEMTVGDMGSKVRKAYTVMGDTVNLGSRLEGITRQYGVGILVSEETVMLSEGVLYREIDAVRVKGKDNPIKIYEPLVLEAEATQQTRLDLEKWHSVLRLYRAQQWVEALALLNELRSQAPTDKLYQIYSERITEYQLDPPAADWDGVKKFDSK